MQSRNDGIDLISIGVGRTTRERELQAIASDPVENNVFMVDDFNQLQSIQDAIIDSLCDSKLGQSIEQESLTFRIIETHTIVLFQPITPCKIILKL